MSTTEAKSAAAICTRYNVAIVTSDDDAARVTDRAIATASARALVAELTAAGHEASDTPDHDDRSLSWVYVTERDEAVGEDLTPNSGAP